MNVEQIFEKLKEALAEDDYVEDAVSSIDGEIVHEEFEEGGRWSNFNIYVAKFGDVFIEITKEVGATEMQEMRWPISGREVKPVEVTVTKYVSTGGQLQTLSEGE